MGTFFSQTSHLFGPWAKPPTDPFACKPPRCASIWVWGPTTKSKCHRASSGDRSSLTRTLGQTRRYLLKKLETCRSWQIFWVKTMTSYTARKEAKPKKETKKRTNKSNQDTHAPLVLDPLPCFTHPKNAERRNLFSRLARRRVY